MSNLIDANELYIRIREQVKSPAIVGCLGGIIAEVPTFGLDDLRPKGRWKGGTCTNCGQVDFSKPNFCPNCGADMREGETRDEVEIQAGV